MAARYKYPPDLAHAVLLELQRRDKGHPPLDVLSDLFQTLYFASLKTEEGEPIFCYLVYLDPDNYDPDPPIRIVKDRWSCVAFEERISLTVSSLVKAAKASDPRTSSFAVYHDSNSKLFIWGLVDQGNGYHDFVNFNTSVGPERPGLFQVSIGGIGHLIAYRDYQRIAELNVDTIVTKSYDVLRYGPVSDFLQPAISRFVTQVAQEVGAERFTDRNHWGGTLKEDWVATLCRLILRIRNYRHGGALLFTSDPEPKGLNVKYKISYTRLRDALGHRAVSLIDQTFAADSIFNLEEDVLPEEMPTQLYLDESVATSDLEDSNSELDGAVWFVSLLSRVDGLVLLTGNLDVLGFGVEILQGSLGVVISQDGDVRVMTRVGDDLVLWESIRLQYDKFVSQKGRRDLKGTLRNGGAI